MKQIDGDGYTSDDQYWTKYVLEYYQWFYFQRIMC